MTAEVREALKGCDLLLLMVEASRAFTADDEQALGA